MLCLGRLLRMLHMLQQLLLLADAVTSALLAPAALLPVLAETNAAALLASVALPPMLAHAAVTALLAIVALPPVRTGARRRKHCGEGDGPRGTRIALLAKLIADRQVVIWGGGTRNQPPHCRHPAGLSIVESPRRARAGVARELRPPCAAPC